MTTPMETLQLVTKQEMAIGNEVSAILFSGLTAAEDLAMEIRSARAIRIASKA